MINQTILPVLCDFKAFEKFMKMNTEWCILMDFHINVLEDLIMKLHARQKKAIIHMDLIHGLSTDEAGAQYACQKLHCDGIISTKAKVIETAKKNNTLAIMRLFMIDSRSIARGCELGNRLRPDYLELLPANTKNGIVYVKTLCNLPLIAGGLIHSSQDIQECIDSGIQAITTTNLSLLKE